MTAKIAILAVKNFEEDSYLFLTTRDGMVNRISLSSFKKVRNSGLKAILLKDDDYLFNALHTSGTDRIILSSSMGKSIMFHESQIRERSRGTQGVVGIKLNSYNALCASRSFSNLRLMKHN